MGLAPYKVDLRDLWGSVWRQEKGFGGFLLERAGHRCWGSGLGEVRLPGSVQGPLSAQRSFGPDLTPLTQAGSSTCSLLGEMGCVQSWPEPLEGPEARDQLSLCPGPTG